MLPNPTMDDIRLKSRKCLFRRAGSVVDVTARISFAFNASKKIFWPWARVHVIHGDAVINKIFGEPREKSRARREACVLFLPT